MIFTGRVGNSSALPSTAAMLRKNAAANHVALFLYAIIELHCTVVICARYVLSVLGTATEPLLPLPITAPQKAPVGMR